jgi:imidazolonepropionase-like amidohydrolase
MKRPKNSWPWQFTKQRIVHQSSVKAAELWAIKEKEMKLFYFGLLLLALVGCAAPAVPTAPTPISLPTAIDADYALTGATLIDGTGAEPIPNAVLFVKGDRIVTLGPAANFSLPADLKTIDLAGLTILPGFINAHIHYGFDERNLEAWAQGGVTTVRDEGINSPLSEKELLALRDRTRAKPRYARLVSAGYITTVPGGYGDLFVSSPEDARQKATAELEAGFDLLKISLEDGYAGQSGLPKLTDEEIAAIVAVAHDRGTHVSGHITQGAYLERMVKAGVDDVAHIPYDDIQPEVLKAMVAKDIYFTPTFTVFRNFGAPVSQCVSNLRQFLQLGGHVALGNDYGGGPGDFELGIPMYEIEQMTKAGMTPMEIITASTLNAAYVSHLEKDLGSLEPGKFADLLIVNGDPLADLQALTKIQMVIHNGEIIRQ